MLRNPYPVISAEAVPALPCAQGMLAVATRPRRAGIAPVIFLRVGRNVVAAAYRFVALAMYATIVVVWEARRATGVTQRRLEAIAAGSLMLALTILAAGLRAGVAPLRELWSTAGLVFGLLSGLFYYLGFSPPGILRRTWQEPELRAFLADAAQLPLLGETTAILRTPVTTGAWAPASTSLGRSSDCTAARSKRAIPQMATSASR